MQRLPRNQLRLRLRGADNGRRRGVYQNNLRRGGAEFLLLRDLVPLLEVHSDKGPRGRLPRANGGPGRELRLPRPDGEAYGRQGQRENRL